MRYYAMCKIARSVFENKNIPYNTFRAFGYTVMFYIVSSRITKMTYIELFINTRMYK